MPSGGRRPSAPLPHHDQASAKDAAETQHTLNYALGNLGGRQKPWMSLHQPEVPRPPTRPPAQNPLSRHRTGSQLLQASTPASPVITDDGRDKNPHSNSTSPQMANSVSHRLHSSPLPSPNAIFPSPTPSDEPAPESQTPATRDNAYTARPGQRQYAQSVSGGGVHTSIVPSNPPAHPESRLSKRPADTGPVAASKRNCVTGESTNADMSIGPSTISMASSTVHPGLVGNAHLSIEGQVPASGAPFAAAPSHQAQENAQQIPQPNVQTRTTLEQAQAPFEPPSPLSCNTHQPDVPVRDHVPDNPLTPPVLSTAQATLDFYTQEECRKSVAKFKSYYVRSPNHPRDGQRLQVLQEAIDRKDWDYLTIHQYYCLITSNHELGPARILRHPHLPHARRLLEEVLDKNEALSLPVLKFFVNFPMPITQISRRWPQRHAQQQQMFLDIVVRSADYEALKRVWHHLHRPPVAREMYQDLGIGSFIFQRIIFMATLRRHWGGWMNPQPPQQAYFEQQATGFFQANHDELIRILSTSGPLTNEILTQQRERDQQQWGVLLCELCKNHSQWLISQQRSRQPPRRQSSSEQTANPSPVETPNQSEPARRGRGRPRIQDPASSASQVIEPRRRPGRPHNLPQVSQLQQTVEPRHPQQTQAQAAMLRTTAPRTNILPSNVLPTHAHQTVTQRRRPKAGSEMLLPPAGLILPQPVQPNPSRSALHQASLQSPKIKAQSPEVELFQYVKGFFLKPTRLAYAGEKTEKWTFSASNLDITTIPVTDNGSDDGVPTRTVHENNQLFRLRCIKWPIQAKTPNEHVWAVADTSWIPRSYFKFNQQFLHQRTKLHHGKDMPIDLSSLMREGNNTLEVSILGRSGDKAYFNYLLAIEIVGFKTHESIFSECLSARLRPSTATIEEIKKKLSGTQDDDEVFILQSTITIDLFDPFSASQICEIPARSISCLHFNCFELQTYLNTRKKKGGDEASVVDHWKCPACNGDARPHLLIIDGFLQEVRQYLMQRGLGRTRSIVVDQDGNWKPKIVNGESPSAEHEPPEHDYQTAAPAANRTIPAGPMGIVDLSD